MKYSAEFLEEKLVKHLDYEFLNKVKVKFPTDNPYFLVCLAEVIYGCEDSDVILEKLINQAYRLYEKSDISSYLSRLNK